MVNRPPPPQFASGLSSFTFTLRANNRATTDVTLLGTVLVSAGWAEFADDRVLVEFIAEGHLRLHRIATEEATQIPTLPDDTEDDKQISADRFREAPIYHGDSSRIRLAPELITLLVPRPAEFNDGVLFLQARTNQIDVMTNEARLRRLRAAVGA